MALDIEKVVKKLNDLIALDRDAVGAYEAAIRRMSVQVLREPLRLFQLEHERHIRDLSLLVEGLGGEPRKEPDLKGKALKGFTSVTSSMGDHAALMAMRGNEELTNRSYSKALEEVWPEDARAVIERNRADEQRHLKFIEDALRERLWEKEHRVSP
jgi:uncharacterized protein (TIGR02284 family)